MASVTVSTPGPAGAVGMTYEGNWTVDDVYQVRDCVRYTDGNLYFCNVQHTAASGNNPLVNPTYWSLFINADDAFQWATKAKHTQISDSLGNTGYSSLHQAAKAQDWAKLTTDAVTNDANNSDVGYSAKAWAIGGTEVTTTASRGASKEWATTTSGAVDTADFSAKAWAIGGTGVTTTSAKGASKEWAIASGLVDTANYSSKEYAQGSAASTGGSAKDYAQYTGGGVRGATSDHSAKAWAVGGTGVTDTSSKGAAKEWAIETSGNVDGTSFSAKEYAQGTQASTGGSAKDYAQKVDGGVSGATSDHSSKAWAVGGTGVTTTSAKGAAKEWATTTGGYVDTAEYSAKEYAIGTTVAVGSAKDWAVLAEDSAVTGSSYSALHHAAKAAASATAGASSATAAAASETAANASADAASAIFDKFDDKYLGEMADSASQGTNPTTNGTWAKDASAVTVASASNIKVGQVVTGTGIPTSPKPNVISIAGTVVTISDNMPAAGSAVALTFTGYGIYGDFNGTKDGPALNNDGDALTDGVKYFNTTDDVMLVYDATTSAWKRMQPTTTEQGHINTVSGIQANVTTVAGISANVTTVAGISANVTTVAGISANTTTVAGIHANVTTCAGISSDITAVAGDATDIGAVAAKATEVGRLGTADAVADMALLGTTDCVADMAILGTTDIVADMALLGTTDCVADMALLGTSAMAHASTGHLKVLSDIQANITTVAGISANTTTVAGISANVTTVAGISANVTTVAGVHANVTTVAGSIADVNRYAEEYKISSSAPGSPSEGDLWYDSTNNVLKFYNGSSFAQLSTPTFNNLADDSTPQLGGNLDVNGNDIVSVSNADIDIQPHGTGDTNIKNPILGSGATGYGIVPVGGIVAVHSGLTGAYGLPSTGAVSTEGWMVCDGASIPGSQTLSGTLPNLTDARFLQGNTHANVGGTGGDTIPAHTHTGPSHTHTGPDHNHTGPSHTHTGPNHSHSGNTSNTGGHSHSGNTNNTGAHSHSVTHYSYSSANAGVAGVGHPSYPRGSHGTSNTGGHSHSFSTNNTGSHSHSFSTNNSGTGATGGAGTGATGNAGTGATGASGTDASGSFGSGSAVLPAYLRVVYLMRVI